MFETSVMLTERELKHFIDFYTQEALRWSEEEPHLIQEANERKAYFTRSLERLLDYIEYKNGSKSFSDFYKLNRERGFIEAGDCSSSKPKILEGEYSTMDGVVQESGS